MQRSNLNLEFDYNFELISIVSSWRDYRLCWDFSKKLNLELSREEDIEIHNQKKRSLTYFNLFTYEDEFNFLHYFFIANKSSGSYLIPELKKIDYFLMIKGCSACLQKKDIIQEIKTLNSVQAIFETNPNSLKSKENLILE